jgi:hypothetical protein
VIVRGVHREAAYASLHLRLMDVIERAALAQEQSRALAKVHESLEAEIGETVAALRGRRAQLRAVRDRARSSQSDN